MFCKATSRSLKLARKLLALPEQEVDWGDGVPIDALRDCDLPSRHAASDLLAGLGAAAVPALMEAWSEPDAEFPRLLIVTLGKIGPPASAAVPLLATVPADHFLAPSAKQALAAIRPPVLADVLAAARSPWTWTGLLDWLLFLVAHPVTAGMSFLSAVLSVIHWHRELAQANGQIAPTVQAAFALLGFYLGGVLGARLAGLAAAKSLSKLGGMCGATVGLFLGGMAASLVGPLAIALRHP